MDDSRNLKKASPRGLLRRFAILSAISVVVILVLVGAGVHEIYRRQLIDGAQGNAIAVAQAILAQERQALVQEAPGGASRIAVAGAESPGLDRRLRQFLDPFGIVKIKVYDASRTIVYSTDPSIIGRVDAGNMKLERVLRIGEPDSLLVKKEQVSDLQGQQRLLVDVVETYVAIRVGEAIVGSIEVYLDVTPAYERIVVASRLSLGVLLTVLIAVFAALYVPMRQGTSRLEQVQERLHEMAATDLLTGLYNRRQLFVRIGEEYQRTDRDRTRKARAERIGFIMADIDHFKSINDAHGHLGGDEALREVSNRLKACLRAYDVIGRYGGEEFLVMLPHTDVASAGIVAERMRLAIRERPFDVDGKPVRITASFGVAQSAEGVEDMEQVIRRADEALYRAKEGGRDRVVAIA